MNSNFNAIPEFIESLKFNKKLIWEDTFGSTEIIIGKHTASYLLKEKGKRYVVILSPLIESKVHIFHNYKYHMRSNQIDNTHGIISIGGAREHNIAKMLALKTKRRIDIITVPVPLTNDSFGTNRYSPYFGEVKISSKKGVFPTKIIIDMDLLYNVDDTLNIMGLGEVIGLYYSIRDYYSVRALSYPKDLVNNVEMNIRNLITSLHRDKKIWLKHLAINLIEKCLIMRVNKDHQIGAGGDHLIAYTIEYYLKKNEGISKRIYHGKLVYMGSIVMAALFPEWEYGVFSLKKLMDTGINTGILNHEDLKLIANLLKDETIPLLALKMRPKRQTSLSTLNSNRIKRAYYKITEYQLGGEGENDEET